MAKEPLTAFFKFVLVFTYNFLSQFYPSVACRGGSSACYGGYFLSCRLFPGVSSVVFGVQVKDKFDFERPHAVEDFFSNSFAKTISPSF